MQNNNKKDNIDFKNFVFEETKYKTLYTKKFEKRVPWIKPNEKQVISYLPGTVNKIPVKKGDVVEKGDTVLIFEAMKMLNSVRAHQKGKVKQIHVKPGDKFPKNQLLIEFE